MSVRYASIEEFAADCRVSRISVFRWMKRDPPLPNLKPPSGTGRGQKVLIPVREGREWYIRQLQIPAWAKRRIKPSEKEADSWPKKDTEHGWPTKYYPGM